MSSYSQGKPGEPNPVAKNRKELCRGWAWVTSSQQGGQTGGHCAETDFTPGSHGGLTEFTLCQSENSATRTPEMGRAKRRVLLWLDVCANCIGSQGARLFSEAFLMPVSARVLPCELPVNWWTEGSRLLSPAGADHSQAIGCLCCANWWR